MAAPISKILPFPSTAETEPEPVKREQPRDAVFFRKEDIRIGTKLRFVGRSSDNLSGDVYRVITIRAYHMRNGQLRGKAVQKVETLYDAIELVRDNDTRKKPAVYGEFTFCYLSYSAIWRLEE